MMAQNIKRIKYACYTTNISMSVVGNLSPVLFITFRSLYGISYSMLGLLVLINFVTQLSIDLIFSFFSHRFNISKVVKATPVLTVIGLSIYALFPFVFPNHIYVGLLLGTVMFSASGGLAEVLISPVIAALPSENPEHEMSKLHSIYAWGVVAVILTSTLFLQIFGKEQWQWLAIFFTLIPLTSAILFQLVKLPVLTTPQKVSGVFQLFQKKELWLCVVAIFLGGATECTMAQWSSGYIEQALHIPKVWGDIFGVALFSLMLGLGRSLYAKYGKSIEKILFLGAIGATVCYLTAAVSNIRFLALFACAFTGFCVSMLWPGCLIVASERITQGGVFIYAIMAAGGDLGASVSPQLVGIIADVVSQMPITVEWGYRLGLTPDQIGMKTGMLVGMIFAFIAIFVYYQIIKTKKQKSV